jgi:hypothetical protein
MKDMDENHGKYGNVSFGGASKLLVDIIGQNVILDIVEDEEKNPKNKKNVRDAYKTALRRMFIGETVYNNLSSDEHGSLQWYCGKYFSNIEKEYSISPSIGTGLNSSIDSFKHNFLVYSSMNSMFGKSKEYIAFILLQWETLRYISRPKKDDPFGWNWEFCTSKEAVITFLTDSYRKIFEEIIPTLIPKKTFFQEISKLANSSPETYKKNINNWQNETFNPEWRTLVPVLNCLKKHHIAFVHRLVGLYLRKNAQQALTRILDVSIGDLDKIIDDIVTMIKENKGPEEFPTDYDFVIKQFNNKISIATLLSYQNMDIEVYDMIKSITKIGSPRSQEEEFFSSWLQVRAKVLENYRDLRDKKEVHNAILKDYRTAFNRGRDASGIRYFLWQFLLEAIAINDFANPRRKKDIGDYYGYAYTQKLFCGTKQELVNYLKELNNKDIRKTIVNIHSKFCPIKIGKSKDNHN